MKRPFYKFSFRRAICGQAAGKRRASARRHIPMLLCIRCKNIAAFDVDFKYCKSHVKQKNKSERSEAINEAINEVFHMKQHTPTKANEAKRQARAVSRETNTHLRKLYCHLPKKQDRAHRKVFLVTFFSKKVTRAVEGLSGTFSDEECRKGV